jgi:hypothetical protein
MLNVHEKSHAIKMMIKIDMQVLIQRFLMMMFVRLIDILHFLTVMILMGLFFKKFFVRNIIVMMNVKKSRYVLVNLLNVKNYLLNDQMKHVMTV